MASLRTSFVLMALLAAPVVALAQTTTVNISTGHIAYTVLPGSPLGNVGSLPTFVYPNGDFPIGPWTANDANSSWISPTAPSTPGFENSPVGLYVFRVTFEVPAPLTSLSALTFFVASDNALEDGDPVTSGIQGALLNGTYVNAFTPTPTGFASFSGPFSTPFTSFVTGTNTLDFFVRNLDGSSGNPVGLRVQGEFTYTVAIPEPSTYALVIGMFSVGVVARRRFANRGKLNAA